MKFALTTLNSLILTALLTTAGASAMAQGSPATPATAPAATTLPAPAHAAEHKMGHRDPAKMQEKMQARMAKHQAELKAKLKITASQEAAWTSFTAAMQPPAAMGHMGQRPTAEQRAEFAKLTTPERIDKMRALHTQRMADMNAAMEKRGDATKAFYATLSPEQQKTFDAESSKHAMRDGHHDRGGRGGPDARKG